MKVFAHETVCIDKVLEELGQAKVKKPEGDCKYVKDFVARDIKVREEIGKRSLDYQFCCFFLELLRRGGREMRIEDQEKFCNHFRLTMVPDIELIVKEGEESKCRKDEDLKKELRHRCSRLQHSLLESLFDFLKKGKYPLGEGRATWVMIGAKHVIFNEYGGFDHYLNEAEKNYRCGFQEDRLLLVKFIGPKVRDLAVSTFNKNYLAVDVNVLKSLRDKQILDKSYILPRDYWAIRSICMKLVQRSRNPEITPFILDRTLWHYGSKVLSQKRRDLKKMLASCRD